MTTADIRRALTSPAMLVTYAVLVVPFAIGWLKTALMTPLALPGYLLFVLGTAVGKAIAPGIEFWVYWVPFLGGCYGLAAAVGYGYERWRDGASALD